MSKSQTSDSESAEIPSSSEEEEIHSPNNAVNPQNKNLSSYENQRLKRIEENKSRMKALGLKTMANSLMGSAEKVKKMNEKKGKRKISYNEEDDEDYRPVEEEDEEELSDSVDGSQKNGVEGDNQEFTASKKQKIKNRNAKPKPKKPAGQKTKKGNRKYKLLGEPDYVDDDDDLMKAIALSLQSSGGLSNLKTKPSEISDLQASSGSSSLKSQNVQLQDGTGKRKKKKPFTSEQMTEDDVILHFFQFDEAGKESISLRDIQAAAHEFPWSDKEMAHMINYFDSDGDGKLNLEDFRKIARRCNMIQTPEDSAS